MSERFLFDERERKVVGFFFFGFALIVLLYQWKSGMMLSQLGKPVLVYPSSDNTYWLYILSRLPHFLVYNSFAANVFDFMLIGSAAMSAINCNKREYALVFAVLISIYFLTINTFAGHHYHGLIGFIALSIPFLIGNPKTFTVWMEMVRYYYLFIFSSAALWKIFRGAIFHSGQLKATLMEQHVGYLVNHSDSFRGKMVTYLIQHSQLSDIMFVVLCILQLSFIIGFFTHKSDRWLFWIVVLFHLMNWMVMRVFSIELIVLNITLISWRNYFPFLHKIFNRKKAEPEPVLENSN